MPTKKELPPLRLRAHPHLYEINTWVWLEQLSAKAGKLVALADVPDSEWDALAERGFDIVWLMGMWQRSAVSRHMMLKETANFAAYERALPGWKPSDIVGSPYSVVQYVPDPRIGTWESLDRIREKLRKRGMALFLDFVGNHTAPDHPWTSAHPEYFVQMRMEEAAKNPGAFYPADTADGGRFIALGRDPYFPPWKDVVQLNYFDAGLREAMITELRVIARHCDGVRCDMAMLQLSDIFERVWGAYLHGARRPDQEFWAEAHAAVPELILLAECYWGTEPRMLELGFTYVYDKELYDSVRDRRAGDARAHVAAGFDFNRQRARFLENHDEPRRATTFGNERLMAVGTLMGTLPGMRFYHQGEIEGRRNQIPVALRVPADEPVDAPSTAFFEKILRLTNDGAYHAGEWGMLEVAAEGDGSAGNLIVYEWRGAKSWKVIAVNVAGGASQGRVHLSERVSAARNYIFNDELNEAKYPRAGKELHEMGLFVRLEAGHAHIFDVTTA
jgi:Alpha amylase, catalytic domain